MEACGSAYFWAGVAQQAGHLVRIIPPQHVKPYVGKQKNDYNDAEGIGIASMMEKTTFVSIKSEDQRRLSVVESDREAFTQERTAVMNRIHGRLLEWGYPIRKGHAAIRQLKTDLPELNDLPEVVRASVHHWLAHYDQLNQQILRCEKQQEALMQALPPCRTLQQLPGIGRVNAANLYCYIGEGQDYKNGRNVSASLGLVPRQHSTGGKERLGGITKTGDKIIRKQLIHGARSVVNASARNSPENRTAIDVWILTKLQSTHKNKVVVALANKLARAAWYLLSTGEDYKEEVLFGQLS